MSKRLYVVHVEFEFAALADSPEEARALVDQASHPSGRQELCALARMTVAPSPMESSSRTVYGVDDDTTWDTAVAEEKAADEEAKRLAEFAAKQVSLPIE